MAPGVRHDSTWEGRLLTVEWMPASFMPPYSLIRQASGLCFTRSGKIVLVSANAVDWTLPGGSIEPSEWVHEALVREVREEACADVISHRYLGCQRVDDPANPHGAVRYYQARYWARVELQPFCPAFEIKQRRIVDPADFLAVLAWGNSPIASQLLADAMDAEKGFILASDDSGSNNNGDLT